MGGTVETHSSAAGVIRGQLAGRRWDAGIFVPPGVEYTQSDADMVVTPPLLILRLTNPLMRGVIVRDVQRALRAVGTHLSRSMASMARRPLRR